MAEPSQPTDPGVAREALGPLRRFAARGAKCTSWACVAFVFVVLMPYSLKIANERQLLPGRDVPLQGSGKNVATIGEAYWYGVLLLAVGWAAAIAWGSLDDSRLARWYTVGYTLTVPAM